jgi:hypothetical protein
MRIHAEITVPACQGNAGIEDGTMPVTIQKIMNTLKPEAAYFGIKHGQRTFFFIFDLPSEDKMVTFFEPFWMGMEADVSITPVMTKNELEKGLGAYIGMK